MIRAVARCHFEEYFSLLKQIIGKFGLSLMECRVLSIFLISIVAWLFGTLSSFPPVRSCSLVEELQSLLRSF
jgi:hypothetical protein